MAILQLLCNHKKKKNMMVLFVGLKSHAKLIMATMVTQATANSNSNGNSLSVEKIRALSRQGHLEEALHILYITDRPVDTGTYVDLLQGCIHKKALPEGREIHAHMDEMGLKGDTLLGNTLINMYVKCGSVVDARRVFDEMQKRDICSWTVMISAYARHGPHQEALSLLRQMQRAGIQPNYFTFSSVLPACANLGSVDLGMEIHQEIIRSRCESHVSVASALVDMYAKCGSIEKARRVFDEMHERNVVSWTAMIGGYVRHGLAEEALKLFDQMRRTGIQPNQFTFASVLPACSSLSFLEKGVEIHEEITRAGLQSNVFLMTALVDMYAQCGNIDKARDVFDKMQKRDPVTWNAMITGYAQNGFVGEALELFKKMPQPNVVSWNAMISGFVQNGLVDEAMKLFEDMPQKNMESWNAIIAGLTQNGCSEEGLELFRQLQLQLAGVRPDSQTFASILAACADLAALEEGMQIHEKIVTSGSQPDIVVMNALIDMYVKCGRIEKGRALFDKMHQRNVVSWNVMIVAYIRHGPANEALKLFNQMNQTDIKPNQVTFSSILPACAKLTSLEQGIKIHEQIITCGFQSNLFVLTALIDMYTQSESIEKARELFDKMHLRDLVSWNTMIAGYAQNSLINEAVELFQKMPQRNVVSWNIMISGFSQKGIVDEALNLFKEMPQRTTESWNAMIAGFTQNGYGKEALKLFNQMQVAGLRTDSLTFASILPVCANLTSLGQGVEIHGNILRSGFQSDVIVANALMDMYAKCGSIRKARELFDKMYQRDVVSWNAMVRGYAMHGCGKEAISLFEQMKCSGINPNHVTLVSVLSACSHAGLVNEGYQIFISMSENYHITPTIEHYICMVDLLGRAGHFDEAQDLINRMPIEPDAALWSCLLGACTIHNNIDLGERVAERLFDLNPKHAAPYVLLSNIYAAAGRWDDFGKVRKMMKDRGVKKTPGCSWIEVNDQVNIFLVGTHPQTQEIHAKLERFPWEKKVTKYVPQTTGFVLNDVEE